uniref:Uncharacterized protein n=1 Tax=Anguilla anguilla TaxID=7936 RepID=A0A0E9XW65_ANGAN
MFVGNFTYMNSPAESSVMFSALCTRTGLFICVKSLNYILH